MKNLNSIISRLSRSGLLSQTSRGASKSALKHAVSDAIIRNNTSNQSPLQTGALAAVGGMAWKAYQVYSQQAYGRNTSLQKANLQRAYQLGVYAQRNAQQKKEAPNPPQETTALSSSVSSATTSLQSRYTPSAPKQTLTYSPATLSQQQFDQVVQDESHDTGQMLILRGMLTAANADGHIDENERQRIYQQVDNFDLTTEDKAKLFDELRHPLSLQELINAVPDPQTAIEVYAASLLAIDEQQAASQDYLSSLASSMAIPAELVKAIHEATEY
ncbi:tellurite resistance TerB family protein [Paraglaciecola sp. MB-3u-78]|uniref:tellurite resistance TerB family protein n=1 Tax=Paraglaciecola sp. MB-3u-78 TaxID=2058332 RepID=UPI000C337D87|nr:tellurite resistance TerB family protein [Paraglaciecola sp. MB-3u-78]PKG96660.1 DUF533 domain-containing protein [Paraglaciecola sp. MB-3u-78]